MNVYLDASVIVPNWLVESATPVVQNFFLTFDDLPVVSDFAAGEVASAIARRWRMGGLARTLAETVLVHIDAWRNEECASATIESVDIALAAEFVRRFDLHLRMPDAIHLAMCERLKLTMATFDKPLVRAAHALGIDVVVPA